MLSSNVKSISDLMSIALQAEREAIRRYSQLAACMREGNNESTADLFERMVSEERGHERLLLEWMAQEGVAESPDIGPISWRDPHVSTVYNDDACDPVYSTPYRALAFAVHNEEIAFRFYTQVEADSANETVRQYAETLAREELGHAALLRAERRLAYHRERESSREEPKLDPMAILSEADLLSMAIHIDRYLVDQMQEVAIDTPEINSLTRETQQQISNNEKVLSDKVRDSRILPGEGVISNLEKLKLHNAYMKQKFDSPDLGLKQLWACCDRSFAFYDTIVETADDEQVMLTAQKLTSTALDRIGVLKHVLGNSDI